jgi:hypothetical protein
MGAEGIFYEFLIDMKADYKKQWGYSRVLPGIKLTRSSFLHRTYVTFHSTPLLLLLTGTSSSKLSFAWGGYGPWIPAGVG